MKLDRRSELMHSRCACTKRLSLLAVREHQVTQLDVVRLAVRVRSHEIKFIADVLVSAAGQTLPGDVVDAIRSRFEVEVSTTTVSVSE